MTMKSSATYGLAEVGLLPSVFGKVLEGRRTPGVAILVVGGATMAMSMIGDVSQLADTTVLLLVLVFISANVSVLVLKKKDPVDHDHFTIPSVVPVLALLASLLLLTQMESTVWLVGAGYLVVGVVLFLVARATRKREVASEGTMEDRV